MVHQADDLVVRHTRGAQHPDHPCEISAGIGCGHQRQIREGGIEVLAAEVLGFEGTSRGVLILQCSMPAAVFNYLFAQRYGRSPEQVASIVVVSTLLAFLLSPLLLARLI